MEWRSPFDEALAVSGPPAVFTLDHQGRLGLDEARSRESWCRVGDPGELERCHCLFTDQATGFVQYVLVTSVRLFTEHPRAATQRFSSEEEAMEALAALGPIPVRRS
jgi:hypothetical protein